MLSSEESAIHRALRLEDKCLFYQLAADPAQLQLKNSWGFTAAEMALYLGWTYDWDGGGIKILGEGENVLTRYTPRTFYEHFGILYLPHLRFQSFDVMRAAIRNCPRYFLEGEVGQELRTLGTQYLSQIRKGTTADMTVVWIDPQMGYGVINNHPLQEGDYIAAYTGVVRSLSRLFPVGNAYCARYFARFWSWYYFAIDAMKEGNISRFFNHSDTPNLKICLAIDRGVQHYLFFANQAIPRGSYLCFDYGEDYWAHREKLS